MEVVELYYTNGFEIYGPISLENFCKNKYYKSTKIWHVGLDGWIELGESELLKHCIGTMHAGSEQVNTPLAPVEDVPPITKIHTFNPKVKGENGIKRYKYAILLIVVGVIISAIVLLRPNNNNDEQKIESDTISGDSTDQQKELDLANEINLKEVELNATEEGNKQTYRLNWEKFILVNSQFRAKEFGGIDNLKIISENKTPYQIDYLKAKVDYLKSNKEVFQTEYLEFHDIKPNSSKELFAPDSKRGVEVRCDIIELKSNKMDFFYHN